jgi:two-component system sensor histidine kinase EvgS
VRRRCPGKLVVLLAFLMFGWSGSARAAGSPLLTPEEQAWIKTHPVVRVIAENNWQPFEYLENGRIVGLVPSYMELISEMTGLRFEVVPGIGWGQAPAALQRGDADVATVISRSTADRLGTDIIISRPFFVSGISIVTDDQATVMFDLEDLRGKRLALKGQGGLEYLVRQRYPSIKVLPFDTHEEALQTLLDGKADAAIGLDATILPVVRRKFYGRLHVSGAVAYYPVALSMVTRSDLPLLASIIDKSLAAIPVRQAEAIKERWLRLADYGEPSIESILRYRAREVLGALGILIIFALLTIFSLRARTAAMRSEREKAMFLAFMSHEIRTPMHTIFSSLELLQRSPLNEKQAERTRTAVIASETLLELLNDLLEYSRLDSRRLELEQIATPIAAWARQTIDMVRWRAEKKRLTLTLDVTCAPELNLIIDPTRLRQIASNLLVNAIKFTESGVVKLRLDYAPPAKAGRPGALTLEVSDTGIGLSAEQQLQIFDAFRQADTSTPRHFGGTGLGLAICKELAVLMRGSIAVRSEPGGLTSFTVRVPVRSAEFADAEAVRVKGAPSVNHVERSRAAETAAVAAETSSKRPLLLVVDDHEAVQIAIRAQLDELGYDAIMVGTGTAALEAFATRSYDMVLLDCNLPDIDGYTVADRMRAHESVTMAEHTPIIAISAAVDEQHKVRCMTSGMDGALSKPIRLDMLRELVELWCPAWAPTPPVESIEPMRNDTMQQVYLRSLKEDVEIILRAIEEKDWGGVRYAVHRIKGSSHVAGQPEIAVIAEKFEASLDSTTTPSSDQFAEMLNGLREAQESLEIAPDNARRN